jgi:ACR3 family arsenite transporter
MWPHISSKQLNNFRNEAAIMSNEKKQSIGFFEKYLTLWVLLCMAAGILIGKFLPGIPDSLEKIQYAGQNIPIAVLIWIMIYPMMMKIDFQSIKNVKNNPLGLAISTGNSWLIKPFLMFGLASLFFYVIFKSFIPAELAQDYVTGAVLLGVAPCTAMVFVWSNLTKGDPAHTLVQVSVNDLLIIVLFVPITSFLLGINNVQIPWDTLFFSIFLFVVIPLAAGALTRVLMIKKKGLEYFNEKFVPKFDGITTAGLLLTLVIIFTFQGDIILEKPFHVLLIAVPLVLQNIISAIFSYQMCRWAKLPHNIAAPASLIAASDFFELAVAVAIALFGPDSPVVLVCTVGVLTEVPIMLLLVRYVNKTKHWFPNKVQGAEK